MSEKRKRAFNQFAFAEFAESYPEGLVYVDFGTEILDSNKYFESLTGLSNGSLKQLENLIHKSCRKLWKTTLTRFLKNKKCVDIPFFLPGEDDSSSRWFKGCFFCFKEAQGFFLSLSDITEQKDLELSLIQAREKAEKGALSKSAFLANTSHEIRTPVHTIAGMVELLGETNLDEEQSDYLAQLNFAADVLHTLINDILDISKIESGLLQLDRTEFNLVNMLENVLDLVALEAHKKKIDTGLYVSPGVPSRVYGDPMRLRQVVINLVNNAVKFTLKGQVTLNVEVIESSEKSIRLRFSVNDSGVGIAKSKQKHLFEAFHQADSSTTRQFGGSGLGLFISKNIVTQMGGMISFESKERKGSSFFFELSFEYSKENLSDTLPFDGSQWKHKILIVENNPVIQSQIVKTLTDWNFSTAACNTGEDALKLLRRKSSSNFKLVFINQALSPMDGWQLASKIIEEKTIPSLRMVLMSLKGKDSSDEAKMKLLGWFDHYLTKPIRHSDLISSLNLVCPELNPDRQQSPLHPAEETELEASLIPVKNWCLLIVEDHDINRKLLRTFLEKSGHEVLEAVNGKEALDSVEKHTPDMVLMDCQMPVMNGYEATEKIRKLGYKGPIVAITASAMPEEREECLRFGMNGLVTKPFTQKKILSVVKSYLDLKIPDSVDPAPPAAAPDQKDIFDVKTAIEAFLGEEETVRNLLLPFMEKMEKEIAAIRKGLKNKDWPEVRMRAHSITGSCLNMRMSRCAAVAGAIEVFAKEEDGSSIKSKLPNLKEEFLLLKTEVQQFLDS